MLFLSSSFFFPLFLTSFLNSTFFPILFCLFLFILWIFFFNLYLFCLSSFVFFLFFCLFLLLLLFQLLLPAFCLLFPLLYFRFSFCPSLFICYFISIFCFLSSIPSTPSSSSLLLHYYYYYWKRKSKWPSGFHWIRCATSHQKINIQKLLEHGNSLYIIVISTRLWSKNTFILAMEASVWMIPSLWFFFPETYTSNKKAVSRRINV